MASKAQPIAHLIFVAAAVIAAVSVLTACQDDQDSSGTSGAADPSRVPGVAEGSVLFFQGEEYRLVALFREDMLQDKPNLESIGQGVVRSTEGEREIEVLRPGDEDPADDRVYTRAPVPLEGGAETESLLYEWAEDADIITPTLPESQ